MEREPIAKREMTKFVFGVRVRQVQATPSVDPGVTTELKSYSNRTQHLYC